MILIRINSATEGRITFPDPNRASIKCTFKGKRVFVERKCEGCGSNEIKNYNCAHCGIKL